MCWPICGSLQQSSRTLWTPLPQNLKSWHLLSCLQSPPILGLRVKLLFFQRDYQSLSLNINFWTLFHSWSMTMSWSMIPSYEINPRALCVMHLSFYPTQNQTTHTSFNLQVATLLTSVMHRRWMDCHWWPFS
jgi:hypothetical protein